MPKVKGEVPLKFGDEYVSRSLRYPLVREELNNLLGKILTIVDASVVDPKQNKAMKDLVKRDFGDVMYQVMWDWCYRKEFPWQLDSFLKDNIVDGKQRHSEVDSYARNVTQREIPVVPPSDQE